MFEKIIKKRTQPRVHYSFYNRITEVPSINWSEFDTENKLFFSLDYLKTIENTMNKEIVFRYIVFFNEKSTPIAFAVTQLISTNTKEFEDQNLPCYVSQSIKNTLLKNMDINILVCGNIFSCGEHGFIFNKNQISAKKAYKCLANALRDTKKIEPTEKPSFILIKEFWPPSFKNSDHIKDEDFRELHIDVNMTVQIQPEWNNFNDYLFSLRTKYRTRAKKVLSNSEKIILKKFSANDIQNYEQEINELYFSVIDNAYFKLGQLNAHVLKELKIALDHKFIFKAYFLKEQIIGFTTCFVQDKTVESFHIGFDYNYKKSHNIYQRMLYDYMDLAIQKNVQELHLGRTAETIKSCIGAQPIGMKLYVRHRNSISNTLLKPVADFITPNTYEIRNPFKKSTVTN